VCVDDAISFFVLPEHVMGGEIARNFFFLLDGPPFCDALQDSRESGAPPPQGAVGGGRASRGVGC
jgi:hypothetical protein